MLKNLERSLEFLLVNQGATALSEGILTLRLGYTEIAIDEEGRIVDASGGRPSGLKIDINNPSPAVPTTGAAVTSGV